MRAQVAQAAQAAQAAAAQAASNSNLLYNFSPAMYSYQQAYLTQLSRMQLAGNEVFKDYLQKLKNEAGAGGAAGSDVKSVMPMLPTVTLPSPGAPSVLGVGAGAASPKTSPLSGGKLTPTATSAALAKSGASPRPQAAAATSNGLSLAGKSK